MNDSSSKGKYDSIINHEHHVSKKRPQMSRLNRAAQFAPFAALVGYDEMIRESGRATEGFIEIDENRIEELNTKIISLISSGCSATFRYFQSDKKKDGGKYVETTGKIDHVDSVDKVIYLDNGCEIFLSDLYSIDSDFFE